MAQHAHELFHTSAQSEYLSCARDGYVQNVTTIVILITAYTAVFCVGVLVERHPGA